MPIAMVAAVNGVSARRRPPDRLSRMPLEFTTCTATSGSGSRISGTRTTMVRHYGSAWLWGGDPSYRVVHGGSWRNESELVRAAVRDKRNINVRFDTLGFRVA